MHGIALDLTLLIRRPTFYELSLKERLGVRYRCRASLAGASVTKPLVICWTLLKVTIAVAAVSWGALLLRRFDKTFHSRCLHGPLCLVCC